MEENTFFTLFFDLFVVATEQSSSLTQLFYGFAAPPCLAAMSFALVY